MTAQRTPIRWPIARRTEAAGSFRSTTRSAVSLAAGNPAATKVELVPQTGAVEIHLPPVS